MILLKKQYFMDFNLTKYEGLSQHHRASFKWVDSSTSRTASHHFYTKDSSSLRLEFPKAENHNFSVSLNRSRQQLESLKQSLDRPVNLNSISVVQYKRDSKALESNSNYFLKRTSPERSLYTNRFGAVVLKNTCRRGAGSQQARNVKQLSEIKHKIVNLPSTSNTPSQNRLIQILGHLTHGMSPSSNKCSQGRKNINFRLKLKRPEYMKQVMKKKIQLSRSMAITQSTSSAETPYKQELVHNICRNPSTELTKKSRTGVKSKLSKLETSADRYDMFNLEPWNIDL